ncbi:MAG TPA: general secretion pathway protein GspB [Woeseiaceae bacterium]|nr:general secretion pathway protein GspB [Woeseiaceae bacterium]
MSFILDALRKSESERQQQQAAEFATVPSGAAATTAPRWLWLLGLLLVLNLVVLAVFLLRGEPAGKAAGTAASDAPVTADSPPAVTRAGSPADASAQPPARAPAREAAASFSERLADVRESRPDSAAAPAESPAGSGRTAPPAPRDTATTAAVRPGVATVPSLEQLQLEGAVDLPPLHLDLHVYNEAAGRRFVSINMQKYRENERLSEGPLVREITREGVVLEHDGHLFALVQ